MAETLGDSATDFFFTNTFAGSLWICPNTTEVELNNSLTYLFANVYSCSTSQSYDEGSESMTPYADADEACRDDGVIPEDNGRFSVYTMMVADTFNPYIYYDSGFVQTTTRFDGQYYIDSDGYYVN